MLLNNTGLLCINSYLTLLISLSFYRIITVLLFVYCFTDTTAGMSVLEAVTILALVVTRVVTAAVASEVVTEDIGVVTGDEEDTGVAGSTGVENQGVEGEVMTNLRQVVILLYREVMITFKI